MDISGVKNILKKLSFVRDYSSLLLPVIILLAAVIILVLTPVLLGGKFEDKLQKESIAIGQKVQTLLQSPVARDQSQVEKLYQDAYSNDANQVVIMAVRTTQRELLSYKIFPAPAGTSVFIFNEFGQNLREKTEALLSKANARDCPTEVELQRALSASNVTGGRSPRGRTSSTTQYDVAILEVLCREKAEATCFYTNISDFGVYEFWGKPSSQENTLNVRSQVQRYVYTGMDDSVKACWYSQLAYWILEDAVNTINKLNEGSSNVLTSPVKRLLGVSFRKGTAGPTPRRRGGAGAGAIDMPAYVITPADAFVTALTGRMCDTNIDVVHFNLSVLVSSKAVLEFMNELCSAKEHKFNGFSGSENEQTFKHNQVTILESSITPINPQDTPHYMYRYGEDAVVQLDLVCEYIFNKAGYDEIKPEIIKSLFQSGEGSAI